MHALVTLVRMQGAELLNFVFGDHEGFRICGSFLAGVSLNFRSSTKPYCESGVLV